MYNYTPKRNISRSKNQFYKNRIFYILIIFIFGFLISFFSLKNIFKKPFVRISPENKKILNNTFILQDYCESNEQCDRKFKMHFYIYEDILSTFINKEFSKKQKTISFSKKSDFLIKINNLKIKKSIFEKIKEKIDSENKENNQLYSEGNIIIKLDEKTNNVELFVVSKKFPNYINSNYLKIGDVIDGYDFIISSALMNQSVMEKTGNISDLKFEIQNGLKMALRSEKIF